MRTLSVDGLLTSAELAVRSGDIQGGRAGLGQGRTYQVEATAVSGLRREGDGVGAGSKGDSPGGGGGLTLETGVVGERTAGQVNRGRTEARDDVGELAVIHRDRRIIHVHRTAPGDGGRVLQLQDAAADVGGAGVGADAGERLGVGTDLIEVQGTCDDAREGVASDRRVGREGRERARVGHGTSVHREVGASGVRQTSDGLAVAIEIEGAAVDDEVRHRSGGRGRDDEQGVDPTIQHHRAFEKVERARIQTPLIQRQGPDPVLDQPCISEEVGASRQIGRSVEVQEGAGTGNDGSSADAKVAGFSEDGTAGEREGVERTCGVEQGRGAGTGGDAAAEGGQAAAGGEI